MIGDASALYNAGTVALERGRLGEAVAFLAAARRIDPRASDVRRNLAITERTIAASHGEAVPSLPSGPPIALAAGEAWWLAALLVAMGSLAGIASLSGRLRRHTRLFGRASIAAVLFGLAVASWLGTRALEEARHPEAVVVAANVEARRGVDEAPRAPVLLRAGERVRVGRGRGEDMEVWLGGSAVGWVPRAALWRLVDTPRYTRMFHPGP